MSDDFPPLEFQIKNNKFGVKHPDKLNAVQSILNKKASKNKKANPFNTKADPFNANKYPPASTGGSLYVSV